nr:HPP family protein [Klebsiella pneumoniae]
MGASAVLLFGVPSSPLAQPWSIVGGNVLSALIGVTVGMLVPDAALACGLAAALAIAGMYFLRCLHPPGGAVALTAILGGAGVHSEGYHFVLTPVLLNSLMLALNDYTTIIPIDDFYKFPVIMALKMNGQYMRIRDKGPLFIVYPYDSSAELQNQIYYSRSAWQVSKMIIE